MGSETGMVLITESLIHLSIITLYNKMRRKCLESLDTGYRGLAA